MSDQAFAEVIIVRAPSEQGLALARELEELVATRGLTVAVAEPGDLRPVAFALSVYGSKAAIVDLSLEDGRDDVYRILGVHASSTDHLLVVSRTPLPLNVVPVRRGGAPPYAPAADDAVPWGNRDIVRWVAKQFDDPFLTGGPRVSYDDAMAITRDEPQAYLSKIRAMQQRSVERQKEGGIFISYRGCDWELARRLAANIEGGTWPGLPSRRVRLIAPGELALDRELLTDLRRWMVVGQLDDALRSVDELWVVNTSAYRGSWWTIAELVMAAYIDEPGNSPPRVRIYDPMTDGLDDASGEWRVTMPFDIRLELAHLLANTRADMLSIEAAERLRGTRDVYSAEFWETLTIEPAHLDGTDPRYVLRARDWLDARHTMVRFAREEVERACIQEGPARSVDGRWEVLVGQARPRHFWVAPMTGVTDPGLRELPTYIVKNR